MTISPTPSQTPGTPAAARSAGGLSAEVIDRISAWWPKDADPTGPVPAEVACARTWVAQVPDIADARTAGHYLTHARPFARWLLDALGDDVTAATAAVDADHIAAYRDSALAGRPTGTQVAICSHLRRIATALAAGPLPVVSVDPLAGVAPAVTPLRLVAPEPEPDPAIERVLTQFQPNRLAPTRFAAVADLVRTAVRLCEPTTPTRARDLMRWGAYLASWADTHGRALRLDTVFHPDTVEAFAAQFQESGQAGSVATVASALRTMSRRVMPECSPAARTVHGRVDRTEAPYDTAEVQTLLSWAQRPRTASRQRHLTACVVLGLAAGPLLGEYNHVTPADIVRHDGTVQVTLRRQQDGTARTVCSVGDHATQLVACAAAAKEADDAWLLGGGDNRRNRVSQLCTWTANRWPVALDTRRLRLTFLLAVAGERHTVGELAAAAGTNRMAVFDPVLAYLEPGAAS